MGSWGLLTLCGPLARRSSAQTPNQRAQKYQTIWTSKASNAFPFVDEQEVRTKSIGLRNINQACPLVARRRSEESW